MSLNAQQIYEGILYRAADEWGIETDNPDRDIGQRFDPLVRFLAGACSSELGQVYQFVENSETRLVERLIRVLLPEHMHLPTPASALALANPLDSELTLDETVQFSVDSDEKDREIAFAPLVSSKIFNVVIKGVLTNSDLIPLDRRTVQRRNMRESKSSELRRILMVAESEDIISSWIGASWYFDIAPNEKNEQEAYRFYSLLPKSEFRINGEQVRAKKGWMPKELILEDHINGNARLHQEISALYGKHFIHFESNPEEILLKGAEARKFFETWLLGNTAETQRSAFKENFQFEDERFYFFFECLLPESVYLNQIAYHFNCHLNVFPVINRRLCGAGNGEHHYLQSTAIKWIHIRPEEDFCSIRKVYEEKPPDYQLFTYKPFSDFKEDKSPSYTLRHGGVGRLDEFNAWRRMSYILGLIQESANAGELLQQVAGSLSLEELHQLLNKKIKNSDIVTDPARDIYILLHPGHQSGMRVRVEYWTSIGEAANSVNANVAMKCISKHSVRINQNEIQLITTVSGGKNPKGSTHEIDSLKASMLSRGRIVTREDVKAFVKDFLGEKILSVQIRDAIGTNPDSNLGATRILEVIIVPSEKHKSEDWFHLTGQLGILLQERSTSILPFKVICQHS